MNHKNSSLPKYSFDQILCKPLIGVPLFFFVVFLIFFLTFFAGGRVSAWMEDIFAQITVFLHHLLNALHVTDWLIRLLIDGVWVGMTSVLSFLPQTAIIFFILSFFDEAGYLSRVAVVMDPIFRPFGISGNAVVPILLGFGCTVPALMCAETFQDSEKKPLLFSLPFVPCSARLPVVLLVSSVYFPEHSILFSVLLYLICFLAMLLSLSLSGQKQSPSPLCVQSPLRWPRLRVLLREVKHKLYEFFLRAGTIVLLSFVVIDFLAMTGTDLRPATSNNESILVLFGSALAPLFAPLGFHDGRLIAALLAGFFAKEAIVSTSMLLISEGILDILTQPAAVSFAIFSLLYTPCAASVAAIRRELGWKNAVFAMLRSITIAAFFSYIFYTFLRFLSK